MRSKFKALLLCTIVSSGSLSGIQSVYGGKICGSAPGRYFNDTKIPAVDESKRVKTIVNKVISRAGGFKRWKRKRSIVQTSTVKFYDHKGEGSLIKSINERFLFKKDRHCTYLADSVEANDVETIYATNGTDCWTTRDGIVINEEQSNERAVRRLRESHFWLRFPFTLKEQGTVIRLGGAGTIDGGRTPIWYLDVLPAQRGDMWPEGFIRLLINRRTYLVEGAVFPKACGERENLKVKYSNLCSVDGISLPHRKDYYNSEGIIASETITGRKYNHCIPERYFQKPLFEAW